MKFSNLHQHTNFSDGENTAEEIVLSAIDCGMESIGISDHSYTSFDLSWCTPVEKFPLYHAEIERLKQKYSGKVKVFKGIELDFYSELDCDNYDYVIGSAHYIYANGIYYPIDHSLEQQRKYIEQECGGDVLKFAKNYYDLLVEHIEKCKPDIVGHFDIITKFSVIDETDEEYRKIATTALKRILKTCNVIEMNTGAISRKKKSAPYPANFLLEEVLKEGGEIVLSSDSHSKETVCFYFDECIKILKNIGFTHIVKFDGEKFYKENI